MKKLLWIIMIVLVTGCTSKQTPIPEEEMPEQQQEQAQDQTPEPTYTVEDYFPFLENTRLSYAGEGNEYAEKEVYFDFIQGNRAQLRVSNPGTTLAQVYEISHGEVRLLRSTEEMYMFYNTLEDLEETDTPEVVVLKEPLEQGTKWTFPDGRTREITAMEVSVETPHGTYEAMEVTTIHEDETKTIDYYAVGIGLVKSVFSGDGFEVITSLEEIEENASIQQLVGLYYPDFHNEVLTYVEEEVQFQTNEEIRGFFQTRMKQAPGEDVKPVIGPNVNINEIRYIPQEGSVTVDFDKNLIAEMNAGVFLEGQILSSIATTFGRYFQASKIYIQIEGKPYESGHVVWEEDAYMSPKVEEAIPYAER